MIEIPLFFALLTAPSGDMYVGTQVFQGPADLDISECRVDVDRDSGNPFFLCHVAKDAPLNTNYTLSQFLMYDLLSETAHEWEHAPGASLVGSITYRRQHWCVYLEPGGTS